MKRQGILVGKFEFNSYGRLMWTLPELHYTPKRYCLKTEQSSREDPVGTCRDSTRVIERSAEVKPENRNI